ncbi:NADH-ubiquinone oxidoreductase-F iron-sulfur binding region domain-containing protein [Nocardioides bruguierae]|uniref:NADH-ubiquinone oxidoreductase 51kDa subunit iron-sulphur binding domain-containing protein n=1 Tax=Nocardioides bruguierae TaxID=2945102 RepID=A0A9X2IF90_9ACTN|nr:NADH-ubiquinone oxidoreductase-F iron-sulfur binding region domain-containing protein [Nocardioides bruguierae]MCM0620169.1 hypothetical protein [Nocardioides bruguierae]
MSTTPFPRRAAVAARGVPLGEDVVVLPGPVLLAGVGDGPSLLAHRARHGALDAADPTFPDAAGLAARAAKVRLRGRGGAGFPLAEKLRRVAAVRDRPGLPGTAARRRPVVVVNGAEGEPASHKDSALLRHVPHLVLDGAAAAAHALRTHEVHVVVPGERPRVREAVEAALAERRDRRDLSDRDRCGERLTWHVHVTAPRFVAGQETAVLQLLSGRENLPVTADAPAAARGLRGRPTLLSNAETFAHLGVLALHGPGPLLAHGTDEEPGTTLVTTVQPTVPGYPTTDAVVREVAFGTSVAAVLPPGHDGYTLPVLVGGFHGAWLPPAQVARAKVSPADLARRGAALGAGVLIAPSARTCPLSLTRTVVAYLAAESAGRCGPCVHGLPALADAVDALARGRDGAAEEAAEIAGLLPGRGACRHPDGTGRLVASALDALADEVRAHAAGACTALRGREEQQRWAS